MLSNEKIKANFIDIKKDTGGKPDRTITIVGNFPGGTGSSDYETLDNKPSINGVELVGNKTGDDLGLSGGSSVMGETFTTNIAVGGIASGTVIKETDTVQEIIKKILTTIYTPTLTNPSATISASGSKLFEKGSSQNITMTINFNRGRINPAYGTSGNRAGEATGYKINNGDTQTSNTFNVVVDENNTQFTGNVAYAKGEQPKDSEGNDYESPLPAGSINTSNSVTYEFVNAFYATNTNVETLNKQPLVSYKQKYYEISLCATEGTGKMTKVDVPAELNNVKIKIWNNLSKEWVISANPDEWASTGQVTHKDASGQDVNYVRYEDGRPYGADARTIRVEWS